MGNVISMVFAVALVTAVYGIAFAQQKTFAQGCSAMSFSLPTANGLNKAMQVLPIPCVKTVIE